MMRTLARRVAIKDSAMTTLAEFQEQLQPFREGSGKDLYRFLLASLGSNLLDVAARSAAEEMVARIERDLDALAEKELKSPDSAARRAAVRQLAYRKGEHFSVHDYIVVLASDSQQTSPALREGKDVFALAMHAALDFLFDARLGKLEGQKSVVVYGLLHGLIDELLAAFHLSQRAFTSQSFAHVRTVEEVLDVVELLDSDGAWLEKWVGFSDSKAEKKLFFEMGRAIKLRGVRDELYAFMSAVGTHAQFRNLQARTDIRGRQAVFFVVGSPKQIETAAVLTARAALAVAYKVAHVFAAKLNPDEVRERLADCKHQLSALISRYRDQLEQQTSIAATELEALLVSRLAS